MSEGTVSVMFRVKANDGYAVHGFTDADGKADVIADYVGKGTSPKTYIYNVNGKPITIPHWHGGQYGAGNAAKAILAALGLASEKPATGKPSDVETRMARLEALLEAAIKAAEKPSTARGTRTK